MKISFHGAAQGVTGSCHLVEIGRRRILIDCGMFQGSKEFDEENARPFGFAAGAVDVLLLTHAHLDHCGRIPLLVQRGFRGEIICTSATRDLARLVMMDAAHLQEEDARHARRHGQPRAPLYDTMDVFDALDRFGRLAELGRPVDLGHGLRATFFEAGHILGSASVLLEAEEDGRTRRILFSGDIGPRGRPLLNDPAPPPGAEVVVMETTYGDRDHRSLAASVDELFAAIRGAQRRGGNVIIPTFALERAQELQFFLRQGIASGAIEPGVGVYLDSPMAISATRLFRRHPEALKPALARMLAHGKDPFAFKGLHFVTDTSGSRDLNHIRSGAIIMAGSGMCTGGRVRHHLSHNLARRENAVIFVGFAAEGTLARLIIDGAPMVRLFGKDVHVRAHIHTINGFSAHAGQSDLLDWHSRAGRPGRTFLVHGEPAAMQTLARKIGRPEVVMPQLHQTYEV